MDRTRRIAVTALGATGAVAALGLTAAAVSAPVTSATASTGNNSSKNTSTGCCATQGSAAYTGMMQTAPKAKPLSTKGRRPQRSDQRPHR